MAISTRILAAAIMTTALACSASGQTNWTHFDELLDNAVKEQVAPGAVLVVGDKSGVLHTYAAGHHTYDETSPAVTTDTIFDMASVSKVVGTGTAAMILIGDGKFTPETKVAEIIPAFAANGKDEVTIRDLANHVSGLKAYESKDKVEAARPEGMSHADALIDAYAALKLSNPRRSKVVYSCLNFQTLARVNETAAGRRQESLLQERLYGPLGMKDTGYLLTDEQKARTAPSQKGIAPGTVHDPLASYHGSVEHCPGNAGLFSSANDVSRFMLMIANDGELEDHRYINADFLKESFTIQTEGIEGDTRGFAWDIWQTPPYITDLNNAPGRYVVGHTGYTGTMIWLDLNTRHWFVLLTNRTWPDDGKKGSEGIARLRKAVADSLLRAQPEYKEWFATRDAQPADGKPAN